MRTGTPITRNRLVCGVGVNDAPFSIGSGMARNKVYAAWNSMLARCYGSDHTQGYEGVTVDPRWLSFMTFHDWFVAQGREGQVDKDLLVPGNKVYSPETCCVVPLYVNCGLVRMDGNGIRVTRFNTFQVQICVHGKKRSFGSFKTMAEAEVAARGGKAVAMTDILDRYKLEPNPDARVIAALERIIGELKSPMPLRRSPVRSDA